MTTLSPPTYMVGQESGEGYSFVAYERPDERGKTGKAVALFTDRALAEQWIAICQVENSVVMYFPDCDKLSKILTALSEEVLFVDLNPTRQGGTVKAARIEAVSGYLREQVRLANEPGDCSRQWSESRRFPERRGH